MASPSEDELPSYQAACADSPPPYIENAKLVDGCDDSELHQDQVTCDINSLPYSRLEYVVRDAASAAPDIYFDRSNIVEVCAENMVVKSDNDGLTYSYSLLKISNEQMLMDRFLSAIQCRSKSAHAKATRCRFVSLETHVVFRYVLTTTCEDQVPKLTREDHFVDFEDNLLPEETLVSAKAKTIFHEAGYSLSRIRRKQLCHETIRRISREFLNYHERIIPTKHCHFRRQAQTVEIFPLQVVHYKYNGKVFKFFSIGECGTLYFPSQYYKAISILRPLSQS